MQDRPTTAELLAAVRGFLEEEVLPAVPDERLRFRVRVAANALDIAGRDLALSEDLLREEIALLSQLLGATPPQGAAPEQAIALNAELCGRIRRGDPPAGTREVLMRIALLKLRIASPRYLR
jgi:hypothetical protein